MTTAFTPPTFTDLTAGDRGYVFELNGNFAAIVAAFNAIAAITDINPILQLSRLPGLILGDTDCLIGSQSYSFTGGINSVTVAPGYAWLADQQLIVQNAGPVYVQLDQAGTWYMVIDVGGNPTFQLSASTPAGAFFSVVVTTTDGQIFNIGTPTLLVPRFISSSNPTGSGPVPRPPLVVGVPQLYQLGVQSVVGLSSLDPRYAGFRLYISEDGGLTYYPVCGLAQKDVPLPGLYPYINPFGVVDYGSLNWVDWYTLLGLPQSEIDKIPPSFKYKLVDQSYVWGNSIMGKVKTADYPDNSSPDTTDTLILDMSESGETLFDPTLPTVLPIFVELEPPSSVSGGICILEGGAHGWEAIEYSAFDVTGPNEITIPAASGIVRAYPLYGANATAEVPADHPIGSRFMYMPYWVGWSGLVANRLYTPRYWVGGLAAQFGFDILDHGFVKLAPIDIDGNEQDLTTVPAYIIPLNIPYADFIPSTTYIGYWVELEPIPSPWMTVGTDNVMGFLYYINRMFTISVPAPGSPVTYYIYMVDPHYLGDSLDYGFLAGTVATPGTGYAVGDTGEITHANGYGDVATYEITQVDSNGGVLAFEMLTGGTFFDVTGNPLYFSGIGGTAPSYNTIATSGAGTGLVVNCTQAGWFGSGSVPRTTCICTTDATKIGVRGYINIGKVIANSTGTGTNFGPDPSVLGTGFLPSISEPATGTCMQFAPDKIFVGNTGQDTAVTAPYTNSALLYPYYNQP